ncbi:LysR family transcriptional regulator [Hoeflea sp. CAU 1731]
MLHSQRLRYLDAIARHKSIRAAAGELHVASSAVNRQLLALEDALGCQLFERLPRRLKLTAVGEIIIEHVRETLKAEARAFARIDALRGNQRGIVTIATTPGLADGPMPEIISNFLSTRPFIQMGLRSMPAQDIGVAVSEGEVDLGLGYYLMPNAGLRNLMMLKTEFGVVVAPYHPLATQKSVRFSDLMNHKFVLTENGSSMRNTIEQALARHGMSLTPAVQTNSIETLKRIVATGDYATLLNPFDASRECISGQLVFRKIESGRLGGQHLTLVARTGTTANPIVNVFVEELRNALSFAASFAEES